MNKPLEIKPDPELAEFDDYRDEDGFYSFDKECEVKWARLSNQEREDIFKYLKLMKRFTKNPDLVSKKHKKWILEHCDLPTELAPNELMGEYWL